MWLRLILALFLTVLVENGFAKDEETVVEVPNLGFIKGRVKQTLGNLEHEKKTFYNFRNIPFAKSVSGLNRFSVSC